MKLLTKEEADMIKMEELKVVEGEELNEETSEFIKEHLQAKNTRGAVISLRKAIRAAKDELGSTVGFNTVDYALNRRGKVTDKTSPILQRVLEMAQEVEASNATV